MSMSKNGTKLYFPERVVLELTTRCNVRCSYCPRTVHTVNDQDMPYAQALRLIRECAQQGVLKLAFFFRGEPLLYEKLPDCIKYAKEQGIRVTQLSTNAFLLDEVYAKRLLEAGVDFISFSISEPYLNVHGARGAHPIEKKIMSFLDQVRERRLRGFPVPQTQVSIVDAILVNEMQFVSKWLPLVERVRIYDTHNAAGQSQNNIQQMQRKPCCKPYTEMSVMANGNVVSCSYDWFRPEPLGNINQSTLRDIWNGAPYKRLREEHESSCFYAATACKNCDQWMMYYNQKGYLGKLYLNENEQ